MGPEDPKGERRKPNTSTTSAVVAPLELADQEQFFVHILYTPDGPSFVFLFPPHRPSPRSEGGSRRHPSAEAGFYAACCVGLLPGHVVARPASRRAGVTGLTAAD